MSSAALRSVRAFRFSLKPLVSKSPASKSGFEIRPIQKTTSTKKKEIEISESSTRSERCGNKPLSVVVVLASYKALTVTPPMKGGPGQGV